MTTPESKTDSPKKRLQITVPADLAAAWERRAEEAGVSLNAWVIMRIIRTDPEAALSRIATAMETMAATVREFE